MHAKKYFYNTQQFFKCQSVDYLRFKKSIILLVLTMNILNNDIKYMMGKSTIF